MLGLKAEIVIARVREGCRVRGAGRSKGGEGRVQGAGCSVMLSRCNNQKGTTRITYAAWWEKGVGAKQELCSAVTLNVIVPAGCR